LFSGLSPLGFVALESSEGGAGPGSTMDVIVSVTPLILTPGLNERGLLKNRVSRTRSGLMVLVGRGE
jgi:hypothetical protein